jgi:hypothetical protein
MHQTPLAIVMDLLAAQQLNSKLCLRAKLGTWVCFVAACGLLGASLLAPQTAMVVAGKDHGPVAGVVVPTP